MEEKKQDGSGAPPLLEVRNLHVWFPVKKGIFARTAGWIKAVDGVSFTLSAGETLGIVGESGCGKSTTARAILKLNRPRSGEILLDGRNILDKGLSEKEYRRTVQIVFQDPEAALNPRHSILEILTEGMLVHNLCTKENRREKATELLEAVGLNASILDRWPHEFSGGQRQRICIARAISLRPRLLICDEAVSALDVSVRAQVLNLLEDLKKSLGLSYLFITHDIGVVHHIADRIAVMHGGRIVETGPAGQVLSSPTHPYTRYLLAAVPEIGKPLQDDEEAAKQRLAAGGAQ